MSASLVLRRRLAGELRALRLQAGLSQEAVAEYLDASAYKIVRIENAQSSIGISDLRQLLALYKVDAETRDRLIDLGRNARKRGGWWSSYRDVLPGPYVQLEAEASLIRNYQPSIVPGLLQTAEYTRAVILASNHTITPEEIDRRITVRMKRQERLRDTEAPLELHALVDEAALHRPGGDGEAMTAQLEALIDAATLPSVDLRILPYVAGIHAGIGYPYVILTFPEPADPDVVFCEGHAGERYFHDAQEVAGFRADFLSTAKVSLDRDASVTLIKRTIREIRT
ncbi:helix-turn-helix domain-containing protein [Actinoallomurus sp. CA-150999]|uniref:helix-turn-helix domain-containing protein n=1 Tax=Actinoallomurus sp. CA-150999 TaxID=3239887 RepID=UPI003D91C115